MNGHDVSETTASTARRACLVEGCTCKDARIVSTRRATYFASVAKARGETADRIVGRRRRVAAARSRRGRSRPSLRAPRRPRPRRPARDDASPGVVSILPPATGQTHAPPIPGRPDEPSARPSRPERRLAAPTRSDPMTNAISMNGLTKHYKGVQALTDLTLDVPAGTVFGFLGPNGAGKTTALKVLAGLARATSGSATVNGVAGLRGRRPSPPARLPRPGSAVLRLDDRARDAPLRRQLPRHRRRSRAPDQRRCSGASASPRRPTGGRRPTRAACASGSASPRPSSAGRR